MIIDQLFTRPIFEAADPSRLIATITLSQAYNADEPTKEVDLTGRFQGDVKSQMNQAADYLTQFLQSKGFNFTSIQLKYQGMVMNAQNRGSMTPQSDWEKEAEATANQMRAKRSVQNTAPALKEFAPSDDDSNGSDPEEMLRRMASHWWNGTERQMAKVENTLAALGWEIGEDEGYDDGGVFVVRAGDEHGRSYISWPHADLELNEGHLNEFARGEGGGDSGNYFKALASAWYNGTYDSGSLQKGIKTKEDIERLLDRGIVAPDGVTRKYNIDYNSDFDGVIIFSDDYYEHGDDDETDSRTGQPFGPYDYMEFSDDDLSESAMAEGRKKKKASRSLGRYFFPGFGYYGSGDAGEGGGDGGGGESANPADKLKIREQGKLEVLRPADKSDNYDSVRFKIDGELVKPGSEEFNYYYKLVFKKDPPNKFVDTLKGMMSKDPGSMGADPYKDSENDVQDGDVIIPAHEKGHWVRVSDMVEAGVAEGEYDSRKPFGVRYKVFAGREGRMTTREYWTSSEEKLQRAVDKIQALDNFYEIDGYSYPKESQGVAEGVTSPEIKQAYNAIMQTTPRSPERRAAIAKYQKLRADAVKNKQQGVAEGLTEMDKSEPSAGRDTGPRPGPDKEAKPITAKKATRDAGRMLNRAVKDAYEKKDVKEGLLGSDPNRGQKVPDWAKGGIIGKIGRKLDPAWSDVQMTIPQHLLSKQSSVPATNSPATKDMPKDTSITPTRAIPQRAATAVPPTFPANTNARSGGGAANLPDRLPGEHDTQLPYRRGMDTKPQIQQIVPSMIKEKSINPLMLKLRRAMVREGRVKELADDLKTMPDADFMKKYGKAKAAIRADMKRIDEKLSTSDTLSRPAAGASSSGKAIDDPDIMGSLKSASTPKFDRFSKTDSEPEFDFRAGLVGGEPEVEAQPRLMVDPLPDMQKWGGKFATGSAGGDNRFTAPAGWRYVEKDEDPARYGSAPAAAAAGGGLPKMRFDRATNSVVPVDQPVALDQSPKNKDKFDLQTRSVKPAAGSGANPNIDAATRDRARSYAAQQNAPAAAAKQKVDWKTIYALNKATIGSNPNIIKPRMQLNMPNGTIYLVQPGDTLTKIAAKQSQINELSTDKLAQYKTAAARDARQADQEGDFKRGDKRFSGIVKATKKQFDNDAKKVDESRAARRALMARIVNHR